MNIEKTRKKLNFPEENNIYQGENSKIIAKKMSNPIITYFKHVKRISTNFICYPMIIINKTNIKIDETNGDLINNLVINFCKKGEFDELEKIKIKINYGNTEILNYNLHDISNIYKMFPEYYNDKFTNNKNNEQIYNVNINMLLNLKFFELCSKINIEITGIDEQIRSEVFFDSYILTKKEIDDFLNFAHTNEIYQYNIIQRKNNEELKINLSNDIIIDKLLVCGDYIHNVIFKDEEIEMNLINNNSAYNKYHNLCGQGNNSFFYFCNSPSKISDPDRTSSGKLFPSLTKSIIVEGFEGEISTLYIQYTNYLEIDKNIKFAF